MAEIANCVAETSGLAQAEFVVRAHQRAFLLLAEHPDVGHVRDDITDDSALRFWRVYSYLVVFTPAEKPLAIVGILHGARDPEAIDKHIRDARDSSE